jgi:hypothetical protein
MLSTLLLTALPIATLAAPLAPRPQEQEASPVRTPRALMIFVDGFVPDAIAATETPHLDRLMADGAWSLEARAESTTISGAGWTTFLTGVHFDKHGIPDNQFLSPNAEQFPPVTARLKEARPDAITAIAQSWEPIHRHVTAHANATHSIYYDFYQFDEDYFDDSSVDTLLVDAMVPLLRGEPLDLAVVMLGELDGVGHLEGNQHYHAQDELYQRKLRQIDAEVGRLLAAIDARPARAEEDWLVILTADHAGSRGRGHGLNIPSHREMPFIVSAPWVAPGRVWPAPKAPDLVRTVLHHLGVEPDPAWGLDGAVIGAAAGARPTAALDANLLVNPSAEAERGFRGFTGHPDASILGWSDPGWMSVIEYGSEGFTGIAASAAMPNQRFFAADPSKNGARILQRIDLSPLADDLAAGCQVTARCVLGGLPGEVTGLRVRVHFFDGEGEEVADLMLALGEDSPLAEDRQGAPPWSNLEAVDLVPAEARSVEFILETTPGPGTKGGWADDLSLVISRR